jgi:hypothetical protein
VVLAVVLYVAGAVAWAEARLTRRVAEAHQRLATLDYELDDDIDSARTVLARLPVPGSAAEDVLRHRATVAYWLARYDSLAQLTRASGPQAPRDPQVLLIAANAAFRAADAHNIERKAAIERLDTVAQAYADVLRKAPEQIEAAYNYELVTRMRDTLAKAQGKAAARKPAPKTETASANARPGIRDDLPAGPTVHGRPGGPPEGTDMSDFKTITPMRYDEREEQSDPGRGKDIRRKG